MVFDAGPRPSASHRNRIINQLALAPRVLVTRSIESSLGSRVCGCSSGGMRDDCGILRERQ
jgi:hypothetical protein